MKTAASVKMPATLESVHSLPVITPLNLASAATLRRHLPRHLLHLSTVPVPPADPVGKKIWGKSTPVEASAAASDDENSDEASEAPEPEELQDVENDWGGVWVGH